MLVIRFSRVGRRNRAQYRIVLQEKRVAPKGRHVAILGSWDPHLKKGVFQEEAIKEWISKGAQVSDSVWNLLISKNIIEGEKRKIKTKKKKKETEEGKETDNKEESNEKESEKSTEEQANEEDGKKEFSKEKDEKQK